MMKHIGAWIARVAFAGLVTVSSYAAVLSQALPATAPPQRVMTAAPPGYTALDRVENDVLRDRVVVLGDRLSNIEGKLDVMEKLDIGLIIAMGGQLLHLALASRRRP